MEEVARQPPLAKENMLAGQMNSNSRSCTPNSGIRNRMALASRASWSVLSGFLAQQLWEKMVLILQKIKKKH